MSVPLSDCEPGEWYVVVTCEKCKSREALFRDVSKGKSTLDATYSFRCSKCQHKAKYGPESLERYRHPDSEVP